MPNRSFEPTSPRLGDGVQIFLEPDLLCRMLHLQRCEPAQVRARPTALARVADAVAQQQGLGVSNTRWCYHPKHDRLVKLCSGRTRP